jgi:acetyl-CoA/propionyl-CoA carboxylase biotin carboxyl carrier protein
MRIVPLDGRAARRPRSLGPSVRPRSSFGDDTLLVERTSATPGTSRCRSRRLLRRPSSTCGERECSLPAPAPEGLRGGAVAAAGHASRASSGRAAWTRQGGRLTPAPGPWSHRRADRTARGTTWPSSSSDEQPASRWSTRSPSWCTGLDLGRAAARVAARERLPSTQDDVYADGHAIEARVYAETRPRGSSRRPAPCSGCASRPAGVGSTARWPWHGRRHRLRPDAGQGHRLGPDRETARARLVGALGHTAVLGGATNTPFLRALLSDPTSSPAAGHRADRARGDGAHRCRAAPPHVYAAAALALLIENRARRARRRPLGVPGRLAPSESRPDGAQGCSHTAASR